MADSDRPRRFRRRPTPAGGVVRPTGSSDTAVGSGASSASSDADRRADFATTVTTDARTALVDLAGRGDGYEWPLM